MRETAHPFYPHPGRSGLLNADRRPALNAREFIWKKYLPSFCPECGSPLTSRIEPNPELIAIKGTISTTRASFAPDRSVHPDAVKLAKSGSVRAIWHGSSKLLAAANGSQIEGKATRSVSLFQLIAGGDPAGLAHVVTKIRLGPCQPAQPF